MAPVVIRVEREHGSHTRAWMQEVDNEGNVRKSRITAAAAYNN